MLLNIQGEYMVYKLNISMLLPQLCVQKEQPCVTVTPNNGVNPLL